MGRKLLKAAGWAMVVAAIAVAAGWFAFVPSAQEPAYKFVTSWGTKGAGEGQFNDPTGIAISGRQVFVSDSRNGRIQVFDDKGTFVRAFGSVGKELGQLGRPMNIAIAGGELFVAEYFNDRIQVFALNGKALRIIGKAGSGPGDFNAPGGVAVAADGSIYVADFYNHRIQKLSPAGAFIRQWGEPLQKGRGSGSLLDVFDQGGTASFSYPTDVAVSKDGQLFVADGYNDRVQVFASDGSFSRKWGGPFAMNINGPFNGWFATVTGIAIGPDGNVFVADFYNHRVQKFSPGGVYLTSFGHKGSGPGQLTFPIAVAVAKDGSVFVADYGNNRITKWAQQ